MRESQQGGGAGGSSGSRWLALFLVSRGAATAIAVTLLLLHNVTGTDRLLAPVVAGYGALSLLAALLLPGIRTSRIVWGLDIAATLGLVLATGDWRTPCYLIFVTALIAPATSLRLGPAILLGVGASLLYAGAAAVTGLDIERLESTPRLESLATHLAVPLLITSGLAYAAELLARLEGEQRRSQRLAIEAERQRIAWELHDSAKQRIGVAHLLLSSLAPPAEPRGEQALRQAMSELAHAGTDLETSVTELGAPVLDGRSLDEALRERAGELRAGGGPEIHIRGRTPALPPMIAAQTYRIAAEAVTNAVRHAEARQIVVDLEATGPRLRVRIADDGRGLPQTTRPGANGLRSMRHRAAGMGARLDVETGDGKASGTAVTLDVPLTPSEGGSR